MGPINVHDASMEGISLRPSGKTLICTLREINQEKKPNYFVSTVQTMPTKYVADRNLLEFVHQIA